MRVMKNLVATVVAKGAKRVAIENANSACTLFFYQPKEPKKLKKLRKF